MQNPLYLGITEGTRRATCTRGQATRRWGQGETAPCRQAASQAASPTDRAGPCCFGTPWLQPVDPRPSPDPRVRKGSKETALEIPGSGSTLGWNCPGLLLPAVRGPFCLLWRPTLRRCAPRKRLHGTRPTGPPPAARSPWPRPVSLDGGVLGLHVARANFRLLMVYSWPQYTL